MPQTWRNHQTAGQALGVPQSAAGYHKEGDCRLPLARHCSPYQQVWYGRAERESVDALIKDVERVKSDEEATVQEVTDELDVLAVRGEWVMQAVRDAPSVDPLPAEKLRGLSLPAHVYEAMERLLGVRNAEQNPNLAAGMRLAR